MGPRMLAAPALSLRPGVFLTVRIWNVPVVSSTFAKNLTLRQLRALARDSRVHAEARECALDQRLGEHEVLPRGVEVGGRAAERAERLKRREGVRLEHKHAAVVGPEVVDLFAVDVQEEVFAHKLDHVEVCCEGRAGGGESGVSCALGFPELGNGAAAQGSRSQRSRAREFLRRPMADQPGMRSGEAGGRASSAEDGWV